MRRTWIAIAVAAGFILPMGAEGGVEDILDAAEDVVQESAPPELEAVPSKAAPEHPQHPAILQLGPREWKIGASLRDFYAKDFSELKTLANPRAHRNGQGKIDGYSMHLQRYGLAHQAGLRNGDVVHSVNGHSLSSWDSVLAAYKNLKRSDEFQVLLTRRNGKRLKLVYHIK